MTATVAQVLSGRPDVERVVTIELAGLTVALVQPTHGAQPTARELKADLAGDVLVGVVTALPSGIGADALLRLPLQVGIAVPYELD